MRDTTNTTATTYIHRDHRDRNSVAGVDVARIINPLSMRLSSRRAMAKPAAYLLAGKVGYQPQFLPPSAQEPTCSHALGSLRGQLWRPGGSLASERIE